MSNNRPSSSLATKRNSITIATGKKNFVTSNIYGYNVATNAKNADLKSHSSRPLTAGLSRASGQYGHLLGQTPPSPLSAPSAQNADVPFFGVRVTVGSGSTLPRPKSAGTARRSDGNASHNSNQSPKSPTEYVFIDKHQQQYLKQQLMLQQQQLIQQQKVSAHFSTSTTVGLPAGTSGNVPKNIINQGYPGLDQHSKSLTEKSVSSDQNKRSDAGSATNHSHGTQYMLHYGSYMDKAKVSSSSVHANLKSSSSGEHQSLSVNSPADIQGNSHLISQNINDVTSSDSPVGVRACRTSSTAMKIRTAITDSQKYNDSEKTTEINEFRKDAPLNIGIRSESVLTRRTSTGTVDLCLPTVTVDEDIDMDGKQLSQSQSQSLNRSHPEVSTSSPSMEFGLLGINASAVSCSNLGVGASSTDSLQEDPVTVGLSTVPNQFCSARDALELKKLLLLSKESRGGVAPSSTAVMDMYMVGKVIGVGSYGKVRAAWHRLTCAKVAIKTYDKSKLKDPAHWKRVHSEIKIMEQLSHPRIARMYEAVETTKRMHLIMECLDGSNLCSYVKSKKRLSEEEASRIFFQILQAVDHLHSLGVSHRDIKLENVLFVHPTDSLDIKLIDFGFSTVCQVGRKLKIFCGTPSYMAPEIVQRLEYEGTAVDMWSVGILLYALLCGSFPFRAKNYPDLYRRIARGTFDIPEDIGCSVTDLINQLLCTDPTQRITARTALSHPWLSKRQAGAVDMNVLRYNTTVLISNRPSDDLDDQAISELETFGLQKQEVVRLVMTKTHSSVATLYYLLLDGIVTKRSANGGPTRATTAPVPSIHTQLIPAFGPSSTQRSVGITGSQTGRSTLSGSVISSAAVERGTPAAASHTQTQASYPYSSQHSSHAGSRREYVGVSGQFNRPRSASAGRPQGSQNLGGQNQVQGPVQVLGTGQVQGSRPLSSYMSRR